MYTNQVSQKLLRPYFKINIWNTRNNTITVDPDMVFPIVLVQKSKFRSLLLKASSYFFTQI